MVRDAYYEPPLAQIHHDGFAFHADAVAPGVLALLEPVLEAGGTVLELGCGSGLLTVHLVGAGHKVIATDASPAMLELARRHAPGADIRQLVLPMDPLPPADAVVAVGHPLSYLDSVDEIHTALVACCRALRPSGVLALDVCDIAYGAARRGDPPRVWVNDDWVLVTETDVPSPDRFVRRMTMFTRAIGDNWQRAFERHDNCLVDTALLPQLLAAHGVEAEVGSSFGGEVNPPGLVTVVGRRGAGAVEI